MIHVSNDAETMLKMLKQCCCVLWERNSQATPTGVQGEEQDHYQGEEQL